MGDTVLHTGTQRLASSLSDSGGANIRTEKSKMGRMVSDTGCKLADPYTREQSGPTNTGPATGGYLGWVTQARAGGG